MKPGSTCCEPNRSGHNRGPWNLSSAGWLTKQGDDQEALRHLSRAAKINPGSKQTSYLLAMTYRRLGTGAGGSEGVRAQQGPLPARRSRRGG